MSSSDSQTARGAGLYVFAKEPSPGQVKTRLVPPLSFAQAARCHRAFLSDTIRYSRAAAAGVRLALAVAPAGPKPYLADFASQQGLEMLEQGEGELGERMERVMAAATRRDQACILVGADTPDLPPEYLRQAFAWLRHTSVVLGPALDGGYYLIGARGLLPPVFHLDARWGGPEVLAETEARLRRAGISYELLTRWRDVDRYDDLEALALRLRRGESQAPASAEIVAELVAEGLAL